jgi:hypothetical protein
VVDELIENLIRTDRDITDAELRDLRNTVASVGFDPAAKARAGTEVAGSVWQGRIIASRDHISNEVRHYLRHAIAGQEWPSGTVLDEYLQSLHDAVLDSDGAILLEQFPLVRRLTFLGHSGRWRGPSGGAWILVGYNLGYGYWVTGFQPGEDRILSLQGSEGPDRRWLQPLI